MKPIKVLIITGTMNVGGIENQLMHLLRQANKGRFQIDFTTTVNHPFYEDEILALGGACIHIPSIKGKHFLRYCKAIYRVMKDGQYDIVHSHELFHSGMVLLTARLAGVKHRFVHAHNWSDGNGLTGRPSKLRNLYNRVMRRLIQKNATTFLACSSLAGKFLYGENITKQDNYHLVFNSVDTTKFLDNYDRVETGEFSSDDWVNVIQVGRYTVVKNQLFTVKIAEELMHRNKRVRILCVGDDATPYGCKVREAIEKNGLQEYMKLLGVRKDIDVLMRKSKVFILPSKYEGMPLVLIEAQASGLQCVSADTFSREVDFGINSVTWLPESADAAAWADAIEAAIARPKPEKKAIVDAIMKNGFDSKLFAKKLCDLYERSVSNETN